MQVVEEMDVFPADRLGDLDDRGRIGANSRRQYDVLELLGNDLGFPIDADISDCNMAR